MEVQVKQEAPLLEEIRLRSEPNLVPTRVAHQQSQQKVTDISEVFIQFPSFLGKLLIQYQQLILAVILILSSLVTLKVSVAIVNTINEIPLLPTMFELIGISYSAWFTFRYLIKASSRQELSEKLNSIKGEVVGTQD